LVRVLGRGSIAEVLMSSAGDSINGEAGSHAMKRGIRSASCKQTDQQLVDLYRAWDGLERAQHGNSIVDFDLAPQTPFPPVRSRVDVLEQLERFAADLESEESPHGKLTLARLKASVAYVRALLGETIGFASYIEQTLGIEPRRFQENQIWKQRDKVQKQLSDQYHLPFIERSLPEFQSRSFVDNEKLPRHFEHFRSKWVPELLKHVSVPLADYNIRVEFASEDAYWKNWISGNLSQHEILLRINTHPRQTWYQGYPETLVIHEYCGHAIQMINWHCRIERGELPGFLGILTVHFPDQFLLEGLAESLAYLLPGRLRLEPRSVLLRELQYYYLLVLNNVHILANEQSSAVAFEYASNRLPFTAKELIEKEIRDRTENPLFRCYQYVYGIAKESFLSALGRLEPSQRWNLLRRVYDCPMTAKQFEEISTSLADVS
jgi:hypothetical protein